MGNRCISPLHRSASERGWSRLAGHTCVVSAILVLLLAFLLSPILTPPASHGGMPTQTVAMRGFINASPAERERLPHAPQDESPAKNPRVASINVVIKRSKSLDAHVQKAAQSPVFGEPPLQHVRVVPVHAQAVEHLPDPAKRLHPGQAPPATC